MSYKSIEEINDMYEYIPDMVLAKSNTYKIYLLSTPNDWLYYRLTLSDGNIFPYFKGQIYLMNFKYKDKWYTFYLNFKNLEVRDVIKNFRGVIMSMLRRLSGDNYIDYRSIPYLTSNYSGTLYHGEGVEWEYV